MGNERKKTKKPADKGMIAISVTIITILVLVVAILVTTLVNDLGISGRVSTVATSKNASIDRNMLACYEYILISQMQNQYYSMYQQYGVTDQTQLSNLVNSSISSGLSSGTFVTQSINNAETYLAYYEEALAAGRKLTDDEEKEAEETVDAYVSLAEQSGMTLTGIIKKYTDVSGVKKSDLEKAVNILVLGSKYASEKSEEFTDNHTVEFGKDKTKYETYADDDKNKSGTYIADYTSYTYSTTNSDLTAVLKGVKSYDELKVAIINSMLTDALYKTAYDAGMTSVTVPEGTDTEAAKNKIIADIKAELLEIDVDEDTGDETTEPEETTGSDEGSTTLTYEKALNAVKSNLKLNARKELQKITTATSTASYINPEESTGSAEYLLWMFGSERKDGDTYMSNSETTSDSTTTTKFVLYKLDKVSHRDTRITRDFGYIAFLYAAADKEGGDTTTSATVKDTKEEAKAKAEAFLKAFEKLETKDKDSFNELLATDDYKSVTSASYTEKMQLPTDMSSFGDWEKSTVEWAFAEATKVGDFKLIESDDAYVVVFLGKLNEENWALSAIESLAEEDFNKWVEAAKTEYSIEIKQKYLDVIDEYSRKAASESEAAAATATTAAQTTAGTTAEGTSQADTTAAETTAPETT